MYSHAKSCIFFADFQKCQAANGSRFHYVNLQRFPQAPSSPPAKGRQAVNPFLNEGVLNPSFPHSSIKHWRPENAYFSRRVDCPSVKANILEIGFIRLCLARVRGRVVELDAYIEQRGDGGVGREYVC